MGTIHKFKKDEFTPLEAIDDLVKNRANTRAILSVTIDSDSNVHISGSRMSNAELCMCNMVLTVYVQRYMSGEDV